MQLREKIGKSRNTVFFQWFVAPEGPNQKWLKNCTPLWREAHFEVKMYKTHQVRTTFGSWDVEKVDAVVARSTFRSQNVKDTRGSDHFWTFRCRFAWREHDCAPCQIWAKRKGFVAFSTTTAAAPDYTPIHYTTTTTTPSLHSTTLHYTTLHYTTLPHIAVHYITFPFHSSTLHYTHYTTTNATATPLH